jgi:hypothetical protein
MSDRSTRSPRKWIGKWIAAVGLLHSLGGFFLFYARAWTTIADRGFVASIKDHDETGAAFWFLITGLLLIILGALIDWVEQRNVGLPRWLGWAMAALLLLLIVPMPMTGAWTLIPPVVALLATSGRRNARPENRL